MGEKGGEGPMEEDEDEEQWYKVIRIERGFGKGGLLCSILYYFVFVVYVRIQCINQSLSTEKKEFRLIKPVHSLEEPTYLSHRNTSYLPLHI